MIQELLQSCRDNLRSSLHWFPVTFGDACPDLACKGTMQIYDNNVDRDHCSNCRRTRREIEAGKPILEQDPANPLSHYQTGGKTVVFELDHFNEVYEANKRKFEAERSNSRRR